MTNKKIVYRIAILLSTFFVLNCGGATNGGGDKKQTCADQGLSTDSMGACFKAEAIPANFKELVDLIDKKYKANPNADLNKIDVSKVTKLTCLFGSTTCNDATTNKRPAELTGKDFSAFNGKIDKWNTSNVIDMGSMFHYNKVFNGDLSHWDVSKVKIMRGLFQNASNFNSDLSKWKVGNVTDMSNMFQNVVKFNSDISGWNVSNVTNMGGMFGGASSFNQDLDSWDVSKVTSIVGMFAVATAYSHPLESWGGKLLSTVQKSGVFNLSAVATAGSYPTWCTSGNGCH